MSFAGAADALSFAPSSEETGVDPAAAAAPPTGAAADAASTGSDSAATEFLVVGTGLAESAVDSASGCGAVACAAGGADGVSACTVAGGSPGTAAGTSPGTVDCASAGIDAGARWDPLTVLSDL